MDKNADFYIREYRKAKADSIWAEEHRPRLIEVGERITGSYENIDIDKAFEALSSRRMPEKDRNILKNYVRARVIMDVVETAVRERLEANLDAAADVFLGGMMVRDVAAKHHISEKTVWRIKQRGLEAIKDELLLKGKIGSQAFMS